MTQTIVASRSIYITAQEIKEGDRSTYSALFPLGVGMDGPVEVVGFMNPSKNSRNTIFVKWAYTAFGAPTHTILTSHDSTDRMDVVRQFSNS